MYAIEIWLSYEGVPKSGYHPAKGLLEEQAFADLITAYEGLRGAEVTEQAEDFAILKHVGMNGDCGRGEQLDRLTIHNAIAMKTFRSATVKHCQHGAAGMEQMRKARHQPRRNLRIEIIQEIPGQHPVKTTFRVLQGVLEKFIGEHGRRDPLRIGADWRRAESFFLCAQEILPRPQQILRGNSISLVHKETDCGLPYGTQIENAPVRNVA